MKKQQPQAIPPTNEIMIRHLTQGEALPLLDQFIHDAFMAGLLQVRIVHGKGTGTLRLMVDRYLANHPLVKSHRKGEYGEGGSGVTIAELAEK